MRPRRVGVVSGDERLFVDLVLRGGDLDLVRVDVRDPGEQDVVLLDVPAGGDTAAMAAAVPAGPAVVVLAADATAPPGTTLVRRPCSVEEVLEALRTAVPQPDRPVADEPDVVLVVDEPAPVASRPAPLFAAARTVPSDDGPEAVPTPTSVDPTSVPRPADPTAPAPSTDALARQLVDSLGRAGTVGQAADTAAALLVLAHAAEHVALWQRRGDHHVVLGSAGLSDGARRMELAADHPVVQMAQARDGMLVHDETEEGSWAPGLPGSRAPVYVMVDTAGQAGPVDLVTAGGRRLDESTAAQLRDLVARLGGAWPDRAGEPT